MFEDGGNILELNDTAEFVLSCKCFLLLFQSMSLVRMGPATRSSMRTSCIKSPKKFATSSTLENLAKKTVVCQEDSQVPTITKFQFSKNMSSHVCQDVDVKPGRDMKKVSISSSSDEGLGAGFSIFTWGAGYPSGQS